MFSPQHNVLDPLLAQSAPDSGEVLFQVMAELASGHSFDAVVQAASNIIINVLRQQHDRAYKAEGAVNDLAAQMKTILLDHHYNAGRHGTRKQGIFPFAQHIIVPKDL